MFCLAHIRPPVTDHRQGLQGQVEVYPWDQACYRMDFRGVSFSLLASDDRLIKSHGPSLERTAGKFKNEELGNILKSQ